MARLNENRGPDDGGRPPVPRLALRKGEADQTLGISDESFDAYVVPTIRVVRMGRVRLDPVRELGRWLEVQADTPLLEDPR